MRRISETYNGVRYDNILVPEDKDQGAYTLQTFLDTVTGNILGCPDYYGNTSRYVGECVTTIVCYLYMVCGLRLWGPNAKQWADGRFSQYFDVVNDKSKGRVGDILVRLSGTYGHIFGIVNWPEIFESNIGGVKEVRRQQDGNFDVVLRIKSPWFEKISPSVPTPEPVPTPTPAKKTNEEIAAEVLAGKWGNDPERKQRLEAAGYDYNAIQSIVNSSVPAPAPTVDILDLVKRTIRGEFGNGEARKNALGSNYDEVQRQVNLNIANGTTRNDNVRLY